MYEEVKDESDMKLMEGWVEQFSENAVGLRFEFVLDFSDVTFPIAHILESIASELDVDGWKGIWSEYFLPLSAVPPFFTYANGL
jgi:hypothetical protein